MSFNDKVVLVTGASSGIGAAIAIKFAEEGAKVAIVGRNESKLKNVSKICEKKGSRPFLIAADVTKDDDVIRLVNDTVNYFGKLDVLVNNAGVGTGVSILAENAMQVFDTVLSTNLRSAAHITNLAAPHLIETKGNIINISSVASTSLITPRSSAYCASKAALDHFTRCVALELAPQGVRVNSVNPGPVNTDLIDNSGLSPAHQAKMLEMFQKATLLNKISEPEEIADLVMYLASNKAQSMTGGSYVIDNGSLLRGSWQSE